MALPFAVGSIGVGVEVPRAAFGGEVAASTLVIDGRQRHLHRNGIFVVVIERQCSPEIAPVDDGAVNGTFPVSEECAGTRLGELGTEVHAAQGRPAGYETEALDGMVIDDAHLGTYDVVAAFAGVVGIFAAVARVVEVHDDGLLRPLREGVAVDAGMGGGCHLGLDAAGHKPHAVIARAGCLVVVSECLGEIAVGKICNHTRLCERHKHDVEEVGAARAAQMGVREAIDAIAVIVVARAGIPGDVFFGVGAELDESEGPAGAGEGTAAECSCVVGLRADKRIDVPGMVTGSGCDGDNGHQEGNECLFHIRSWGIRGD